MALIFSQGYMRGNGNPNLDNQIKDGGSSLPKLYIDDTTDTIYGFDSNLVSGEKWFVYISGIVSKNVDINIWLYGANINGVSMRTSLATSNLLPLAEPYEGLGYVRSVFYGETVANNSVFTTNNIVDWILVELRDEANPEVVLYNRAGLLRSDGKILDVDGVSLLEFPFISDTKYFVSVKHRNHLGIMTKYPVDITDAIDFTSATTEYYGNTSYLKTVSGRESLRSGKVTDKGVLLYGGNNSWAAKALAFLGFSQSATISNVYSVFDVTLNGIVNYGAVLTDRITVLNAVDNNQSKVFIEQIPPFTNVDIYEDSFVFDTYDVNSTLFKSTSKVNNRSYEEKYYGKTALVIPKGTTAERPTSLESGMVRYNTTDNKLEYYNGTVWVQL